VFPCKGEMPQVVAKNNMAPQKKGGIFCCARGVWVKPLPRNRTGERKIYHSTPQPKMTEKKENNVMGGREANGGGLYV